MFRRLFEERQRSDYLDLAAYTPAEVAALMEQVPSFIDSIRQIVNAATGD